MSKKIADTFPSSQIVGITKNLSELSINFGYNAREVVGVLATIMNALAVKGVNIAEAIGCMPEYMLFVDTRDILKAHEILMELSG